MTEPNLFDSFIEYFAPVMAVKRQAARAFLSAGGFTGASRTRRQTKNFRPQIGSADSDTLPDLETLRARGRHLTRNNPYAAGALNTVTDNTVGTGLVPQSQPDGDFLGMSPEEVRNVQQVSERHFGFWATNPSWCDVTQMENFAEQQDTVVRSKLDSGDTFVLRRRRTDPRRPYGLALQLIEADRVYNPSGVQDGGTDQRGRSISGGVEFDNDGAPVAYHIGDHHPGDLRRIKSDPTRVRAFSVTGARRVLHLMSRLRPGQSRGVPYVAGIVEPSHVLDRFTEAQLLNATVSSMFTAFIETNDASSLDTGDALGLGPLGVGSSSAADRRNRGEMAPGAIVEMFKGEKVNFADPKSPSPQFAAFEQAVVRQMAMMLDLPYEILVKHYQSSYSAARAAMLDAWTFFKRVRKWLVDNFCQPVWEWFFEELVIQGYIRAPGFFDDPLIRTAYTRAIWSGEARGQIDSVKEVNAARSRIAGCLSSLTDETVMLTGKDWETVMRRRAAEIRILQELNLTIPPELQGADAAFIPIIEQTSGEEESSGGGSSRAGSETEGAMAA